MKRKVILLGIILAGLLCACEEFEGLFEDFGVTMTTDYIEVDVLVPPGPAGAPVSIITPMQTDVEAMVTNKGYTNATIQSIRLADAILEVDQFSPVDNLNSIDTLSTAMATEELPLTLIASCRNEWPDAESLTMNTADADLTDYVMDGIYTLKTSGMLKENLTDTLRVKAKIRFRMKLSVSSF